MAEIIFIFIYIVTMVVTNVAWCLCCNKINNEWENDREKLIVNYCICKEYRQNAVAKMLEVEPSTINRTLKNALRKMRRYIIICDKVLTYYGKECKKHEEI